MQTENTTTKKATVKTRSTKVQPIGLTNCPVCDVNPGHMHNAGCTVERCSNCGDLQDACDCTEKQHDPIFARWTGIWPGFAEAQVLGIRMEDIDKQGLNKILFVKPSA